MENLPVYISVVMALSAALTVAFFYKASDSSGTTLTVLTAWLALQMLISSFGYYKITDTVPPRFLLLVVPPLLVIAFLFLTKVGRNYIDGLDLKVLTILHIVRVPVELVLFWLYLQKGVPELMTFEGRNFDILSGLSAPLIFYLCFISRSAGKKILLVWNFICLGLLVNIVIIAALSAPSVFQQLAFDQPNHAVIYFPFVWLPCCIVPLVLLSHLAAIRKLLILQPQVHI